MGFLKLDIVHNRVSIAGQDIHIKKHSLPRTSGFLRNGPEGRQKLAGGASHRTSSKNGIRPGGGGGSRAISRRTFRGAFDLSADPVACATGKFPLALRAINLRRISQSRGYTIS